MVSLGKTNTPEFGSPCYTEPDGAPPARHAVGPDPDGRRLERRSGGGGRRRAGAGRPGLRRRRLDPDPGVLLRAGRAQADARPDQRRARCTATRSAWRRPAPLARTVRDAAAMLDVLAGRAVGRPVLGARARRRRSSPPATASPGGCGSRGSSTPVIADADVDPECLERLGGRLAGCWSRSATRSRTSTCRCRREAVPVFETCWAVLTALSVVHLPDRGARCCAR